MKSKLNTDRVLFLFVALGACVSFAQAGPGVQYWSRTRPVTTTEDVAAIKPDDTVAMVCGACKTVMLRDPKHVGPQGKGHEEWFTAGSKHSCDHCGGEISVVKGKTSDSMQHNCSKCGAGAASCCATAADKP